MHLRIATCRRLLADRDVLVQPYLSSIDGYGEGAKQLTKFRDEHGRAKVCPQARA